MIKWVQSKWSLVVSALICAFDLFFTFLTYFCGHEYSFSSLTLTWDALSSFESDTADLLLCVVVRVGLLCLLFVLALVYAKPDYARALEEKQREARQHNRRIAQRRDDPSDLLLSINAPSSSSPAKDKTEALLSAWLHPPTQSPDDPIPIPRELAQSDKHVINRRCSRYRTAISVAIFVLCTLMQVLIGVKIVSFGFPRSREFPYAMFMALPILFINLEQHYTTRLIARMTREEGYLFKELHPHKLYFDIQVRAPVRSLAWHLPRRAASFQVQC